MAATRIIRYGRLIFMMLLAVYLILAWMYFKDNAEQLNSSGLLLWFMVIPLLFIGAIVATKWWQKRIDHKESDEPKAAHEKTSVQTHDTYKLFIHSSVSLPEGSSWSEVINNQEDLTSLSDTLTDFDGLPLLTKPIAGLTEPEPLPYYDTYNEETTDTDISPLTLRLYALLDEQLSLNAGLLSRLAQYFAAYQPPANEPNSAVHIHPEWQQRYLISADFSAHESDADNTLFNTTNIAPAKLSIYLVLPASADATLLSMAIEEQMLAHGIPKARFFITPVTTDITDEPDAIASTTLQTPIDFINAHLLLLSQSTDPEICLLLIADSQINEAWLEEQLTATDFSNATDSANPSSLVPTEAGALLTFYNQAAQDVLNIDNSTAFLFTKVNESNDTTKDSAANTNSFITQRLSYSRHLNTIRDLLVDHSFSLTPTNIAESKTTDPSTINNKKITDKDNKTKVLFYESNITAISDINPEVQPYDTSVFSNFTEAFIEHGALINTYHLGSYMTANVWLKSFISLSLFVSLVYDDQRESKEMFLITQHQHSCLLWTVDAKPTI